MNHAAHAPLAQTHLAHGHSAHIAGGGFDPLWLLQLLVAAAALGYGVLVWTQRRRRRSWPALRTLSFALGTGLLALGLSPNLMARAHMDIGAHMTQHLLLGMYAPLPLVLGWPVTLLLRGLPVRTAHALTRALHRAPLRWLVSPLAALVLNVGGMALLYLTPLYAAMLTQPWLHLLVHVHVIAAGFLFTLVVAGAEPLPGRAPFRWRVGTLLAGMTLHAVLAKVMYARLLPAGLPDAPEHLQAAARQMYYWGDLSEILLAILLFWGWLRERDRARAREQAREERRAQSQLPGLVATARGMAGTEGR